MGSVNNRGSEESSTGSVNGVVACTVQAIYEGGSVGRRRLGREEKRKEKKSGCW